MATPVSAFSGTPTTGHNPLTVQFTDASTNTPTGWAWYFGDEKYDGEWVQQTAGAEWPARIDFGSAVLLNGDILIMGGWSFPANPDILKNDVWKSSDKGITWTLLTEHAGWGGRKGLSCVVLTDGSVIVTGGDSGSFNNDVWRSTDGGSNWTQMTASAEWSARAEPSVVALLDGSVIILGGNVNGVHQNDIWKSNDKGATWNMVVEHAEWSPRYNHKCVVISDGSVILIGGYLKHDVWRSEDNGLSWTQISSNPEWESRFYFEITSTPDDNILVMGGDFSGNVRHNDVWRSVDVGVTWVKLSNAEWTPRDLFRCNTLNDGSVIFLGGSSEANYNSGNNDVWRLETAGSYSQNPSHIYTTSDKFNVALQAYNSTGYDSEIKADYITSTTPPPVPPPVSAFSGTPTTGHNPLTVQFTDASTNTPTSWAWYFGDEAYTGPWVRQTTDGGFEARVYHTCTEMQDGSIIITGGLGSDYLNDVWRSTDKGISWTQMTAHAEWSKRAFHSCVALPDGSIVLMGGVYSTTYNDVWRSTDNGATWVQQTTTAEWNPRYSFSSVVMPDESIVVMGGTSNSAPVGNYNDVWRSTDKGETWVRKTASAGWDPRILHSSTVTSNGSILVIGGYNFGTGTSSGVWKSIDLGINWSKVNSSNFNQTTDTIATTLPNGCILVTSGTYTENTNDTYISTDDGNTWTLLTIATKYTTRLTSGCLISDGSLILVSGQTEGTIKLNDVWRLETAGSYSQNPSHIYATAGVYDVALQAYNSTGYDVELKRGYIEVLNPHHETGPTFNFSNGMHGIGTNSGIGMMQPWGPSTESVDYLANSKRVFEEDVYGDLMPMASPITRGLWEVNEDDEIQPVTSVPGDDYFNLDEDLEIQPKE
jgi:PKD repeat protein